MKWAFNHYSDYIKKKYGQRVQKISIDAGFTCPNRDGTKGVGGCTYCNNDSFSFNSRQNNSLDIHKQIQDQMQFYKSKGISKFSVYFQTYSNTYAPIEKLKNLYDPILQYPDVIGINIGTRSDCIDEEKIKYFAELNKKVDITIEYGLESANNSSLLKINRGHNIESFTKACELTHSYKIPICAHLILGFPWESSVEMLEGAKFISKLPITYLKLHQLQIIKGTQLGNEYIQKPYPMLTQVSYFNLLADFIKLVRPDIVIERLFSSAPKELILSEDWNKNIGQLNQEFNKFLQEKKICQGLNYCSSIQ